MTLEGFMDEETFGYSVSISADGAVIAIGAPDIGPGLPTKGQVRAYEWNGSA